MSTQMPSPRRPGLPLRVANVVGFVGTVAVNALAVLLPIGGMSTGALSDLLPNLFVPAGLTFSIWGVIYLLLGVYAVYQLRYRPFVDRIGWLFVLSSLANMGWILAWNCRLVVLSLVVMLVLLGTLIIIYGRLFIGRSTGSAAEKWLVHVCFSVYLGWITIATVANATAVLVHLGWGRFGLSQELWAVAVIAVATLITLLVLIRRGDIFFAAVVTWAFAGIILKRASVGGPSATPVIAAAAICGGIVVIVGAIRAGRYLRY